MKSGDVEFIQSVLKDLDTLLVCSFRYALGRSTYIVHDVCEIIKTYSKLLSSNSLILIQREIMDAINRNQAGMRMDIEEWTVLTQEIGAYLENKHV